MLWSHAFLYYVKGIELYIRLFGTASKMRGDVKVVIKSDFQYVFFFAIFNSKVVRCEICLQFILNAKYHKGTLIRIDGNTVFIKSLMK